MNQLADPRTAPAPPPAPRVLILDNQPARCAALAAALRRLHMQVLVTPDGPTATYLAVATPPDLAILNTLLPDAAAADVCRAIRRASGIPILLLADRGGRAGAGWDLPLEVGDLVARPLDLDDILGRVQAMLPAQAPARHWSRGRGDFESLPSLLRSGDLVIDLAARQVTRAGRLVPLKPQEFELLAFLAQHPGRVFTRLVLMQRLWSPEPDASQRTVDVHVRWLRAKLEPVPSRPEIIQTVYRIGYRYSRPVEGLGPPG